MPDAGDLRDRLVGRRFFDRERAESFTVVGVTDAPPLALLQYDDGVAWDEGATNFTVGESGARRAALDDHGLDSERYRPLGPGPRVDQTCDSGEHTWFPWPDTLWPDGPPESVPDGVAARPRDLFRRVVRCARCGLSGDVAGQFGFYEAGGSHVTPWFCAACGEAHAGSELVSGSSGPRCRDCTAPDDPDAGA